MTIGHARLAIEHSLPSITAADAAQASEAVRSGWVAQGRAALAFATALQSSHDAERVVLTSSGTAGIVVALRALGIGAGDEVVLPSYVCASVLEAVRFVGASPVLCDIGKGWRAAAAEVQAVMTLRTRAVIAVSMFGIAADIEAIAALGVPVIDDRCQAFGLPRTLSAAAAYSVCSFHATKCFTAGEGGAVIAWSGEQARQLAEVQRTSRRTLCVFSDMQATLAHSQLERWPVMLQRRREIAKRYLDALPAYRTALLESATSGNTVWYRFPILLDEHEAFDDIRTRFLDHDVHVRRGVDALLHRSVGLPDESFPETTRAFARTLSLPIWPAMSNDDIDHVIEAATDVLGR